tara:strand:- start:873 stop:1139 length:267 start_codon:yes stop_codon:yes gene_type:complete
MNPSPLIRIPQTLFLTIGLTAPVFAQNLTTFTNGEVADAGAVNANFSALKSAVDSKAAAASVTNLTSSVNSLTGQIWPLRPLALADLE